MLKFPSVRKTNALSSGGVNGAAGATSAGTGAPPGSAVVPTLGMTEGGIQTTSTGSLNSFGLMSNLAKQYAAPVGQRVFLFVAASPECCLEGGVETVLKYRARSVGGGGAVSRLSDANAAAAALEEKPDNGDDFDAFAFLSSTHDDGSPGVPTDNTRKKGIGGFFRKAAASATATLERQMQGLAVRMDKGRNPDLLCAALYDIHSGELLGVTEVQPVPPTEQRTVVKFAIPLVVDGRRRLQSFVVKLWMRSGAAVLQATKGLSRNYLLGQTNVNCAKLLESASSVVSLPLTSHLIVNGSLLICPVSDPKFPRLCHRGWSLTDPDMSAYSSQLAYLPLDQSYHMKPHTTDNQLKAESRWILATERAIESSVVLPVAVAVTEAASRACHESMLHAQSVGQVLRINRHDVKDVSKAVCKIALSAVQTGPIPPTAQPPTGCLVSVAWRRPDSIFEVELFSNNASLPVVTDTTPTQPAVEYEFYPKLCTDSILPSILNTMGGRLPPSGYLLGNLYISVQIFRRRASNNKPNDGTAEFWETQIGLDSFVNQPGTPTQIPLYRQGQPAGHIIMGVQTTVPSTQDRATEKRIRPATNGLVSFVGLDKWADGVAPSMDDAFDGSQEHAATGSAALRYQQLATMGMFCTVQYMYQHLPARQTDWEGLDARAKAYRKALTQPQQGIRPHQTRTPKFFRPSSSRPTELLSGLPFNVHNASLSIMDITVGTPPPAEGQEPAGVYFHNITCGAPADHARGFRNILEPVTKGVAAPGGLRRLETKRVQCYQHLQQAQTMLISGVGHYLATARQNAGGAQVNHIPSRDAELQALRWRVFECVHNLHHITWHCAVRRANVFSQSLGLALTSYLACVSDARRASSTWPELWKRHGFLVSYEGLLSAVGKELGMIEDASVAIAMLRMVRVVFVSDSGQAPQTAVDVSSSPYLKWLDVSSNGVGSARQFLVQIGIERGYYQQRIPASLQNGAAVQFFPILWEVGVDIRQWGAHNAKNMQQQMNREGSDQVSQQSEDAAAPPPSGDKGILDDDDDDEDVGIPDDDVLVALNYEALRKINVYTYAVNPQNMPQEKIQAAMQQAYTPNYNEMVANNDPSSTSTGTAPQDILPVHPSLSLLHSHIISSAGKMNHSILDEAATIAQQLGGGGLVFCKSGKDRTAMHLTYKQAQFTARYQDEHDAVGILKDATMMRVHGTRLPVCEKNVGESKYAFNSLQVKFMPEALQPPLTTLAGFKFSIES